MEGQRLRDTTDHSITTYNDDNLEVENKYYIDSYIKRHRKRIYNEDNKIIEELWNGFDGWMRMRYVNEYDEHGRLVMTARYTDDKEDFRLEYEYKGNVRYCTTYIPRVKTKTTREEYTYFD